MVELYLHPSQQPYRLLEVKYFSRFGTYPYYTSDLYMIDSTPGDSPEEIASESRPANREDYDNLASLDNKFWITGHNPNGGRNAQLYQFIVFKDDEISFYDPQDITQIYIEYQGFASPETSDVPLYLIIYNYRQNRWERLDSKDFRNEPNGYCQSKVNCSSLDEEACDEYDICGWEGSCFDVCNDECGDSIECCLHPEWDSACEWIWENNPKDILQNTLVMDELYDPNSGYLLGLFTDYYLSDHLDDYIKDNKISVMVYEENTLTIYTDYIKVEVTTGDAKKYTYKRVDPLSENFDALHSCQYNYPPTYGPDLNDEWEFNYPQYRKIADEFNPIKDRYYDWKDDGFHEHSWSYSWYTHVPTRCEDGYCSGEIPCEVIHDPFKCDIETPGCEWTQIQEYECVGEVEDDACDYYSYEQCNIVPGCTWFIDGYGGDYCSGTPDSCNILTQFGQSKCLETPFCEWSLIDEYECTGEGGECTHYSEGQCSFYQEEYDYCNWNKEIPTQHFVFIVGQDEERMYQMRVVWSGRYGEVVDDTAFFYIFNFQTNSWEFIDSHTELFRDNTLVKTWYKGQLEKYINNGEVHLLAQTDKEMISSDNIYVDIIRDSFREMDSSLREMKVKVDGKFSFSNEWTDAQHYTMWMSPSSQHPAGYAHFYLKNDMDHVYFLVDLVPDATDEEACEENEEFSCQEIGNEEDCEGGYYPICSWNETYGVCYQSMSCAQNFYEHENCEMTDGYGNACEYYEFEEDYLTTLFNTENDEQFEAAYIYGQACGLWSFESLFDLTEDDSYTLYRDGFYDCGFHSNWDYGVDFTTSPNSNQEHRIWEYKIPIESFINYHHTDRLRESIGMQLNGYGTLALSNLPKSWTWPMNTYLNIFGIPADDFPKLDPTDASGFGQLNFADEYSLDQQWYYESSGKITEITTGDFDGDGREEVAAIDSEKNSVFVIDGYNVLWNLYPNYNGFAIAAADLDGDGRDELIVGGTDDTNNGVFAFDVLNDKLVWVHYVKRLDGEGQEDTKFIIDLEIGDIDGDDLPEIGYITTLGNNNLFVIDQDGDKLWKKDIEGAADIDIGDFDGDGMDDIAIITPGPLTPNGFRACYQDTDCGSSCCYKTGDSDYGYCANPRFCGEGETTVYVYDGDGNQISRMPVSTSFEFLLWFLYYGDQAMPFNILKLDDLDGDGDDEVIVAGKRSDRNGIFVYQYNNNMPQNRENLWRYEPPESNFMYGFTEIAVGDIDGDGDKEVMAIDGMSVKSDGDGPTVYVFGPNGRLRNTRPHSGFALAIEDITNDGEEDFLVGGNDGRLYVYNKKDPVWSFDTNIPEDIQTEDYCKCYDDEMWEIRSGQCEFVPLQDYYKCPIDRLECFEEETCEWYQENEVCPTCGDGVCNGDETGCKNFAYDPPFFDRISNPPGFCPQDCGFDIFCDNEQRCGDNYCGGSENFENCPQDCKDNPVIPDGYCQPHYGETCERNPWDCGVSGKPGDVIRDIKVADVNGDNIKDTIVSAGNKLWILSSSLPVAQMRVDKMVIKNTLVEFDGTKSHDPDGSITNYDWDLGNSVKTGSIVTNTYSQEGLYGIQLTVTDDNANQDTDSEIISVRSGIISQWTSTPVVDGIMDQEYNNGDIKELKFVEGIHKGDVAGKIYTLNDDHYIYFLADLYGKDSGYADIAIHFDTDFDFDFNPSFRNDDIFYLDSSDGDSSSGNHPEWLGEYGSNGNHVFEFAIPIEGLVNYRGNGPFYRDPMPILIVGDPNGDKFAWPEEELEDFEDSVANWGLIDLAEAQEADATPIWHYEQGTLRDVETDGTNIAVITDNYEGGSTLYLLDSLGNEIWNVSYFGDVVRIYGDYIVAGVNSYENGDYIKAFYKANGTEIWSQPMDDEVTDIEIGNFDGNDLVVAGDQSDSLFTFYLTNGNIIESQGHSVNDIALGDVDGYGGLEIATIGSGNSAYLYSNEYLDLTFEKSSLEGMAVEIGNVHPNPGNEIVFGAEGESIYVYSNSGTELIYNSEPEDIADIALGDLNNDGYDDIAAITEAEDTTYILNGQTGAILWQKQHSAPPAYKNRFQGGPFIARDLIHIANIYGSSTNEVVLGAVDGNVYVYNNDGSINRVYETGEWIEDIAIGDMNNDGLQDIIIGTSSSSGNVIVISGTITVPTAAPAGGGGGGGGGSVGGGYSPIEEEPEEEPTVTPPTPTPTPIITRPAPAEEPKKPVIGEAIGALFAAENLLGLLFLLLLLILIIALILNRDKLAALGKRSHENRIKRLIEQIKAALDRNDTSEASELYSELRDLYNKQPEKIKNKYYQAIYGLYKQLRNKIQRK